MLNTNMETEIKSYIEQAIENENYEKYEIILTGSTERSDGYASYITFATVIVTTGAAVKKNIELAVKTSKRNFLSKYRNAYEREVYVYKTILPEFTKFQLQNNINQIFNSFPKCYKTISNETAEVIVMENLRRNGYHLYDRTKPLDLNHLKLVLREYGKLHAISFAFREKRKDDFEKLTSRCDVPFTQFFDEPFTNAMQQQVEKACVILQKSGEMEAFEMYKKLCQKTIRAVLPELLVNGEKGIAVLHGDCWNNNFVYKYEEHGLPSKVAILDWQISRIASPVLDLSYFMYCTSSVEQLEHFDELLDIYYTSFSTFLTKLGCDPEKLFPFSTFQRHWKKYSLFGVLMCTLGLHVFLCDKNDAPDLTDPDKLDAEILNVEIKNDVEYQRRLIAVISHYTKYNSQ